MPTGETPPRRRLADAFEYGVPGPRRSDASDPSSASNPAVHPARRRRRVVLGLVVVAGILAGVVGVGALVVNNKFDLIDRLGIAGLDAAGDNEPRNYLLVGSDDRAGLDPGDPNSAVFIDAGDEGPTGQRADVIMVMRVDPRAERIDVVSIPRDLWVPIAGWDAEERINTAYTEGPQQLVETIRNDFDIQINNYVEVDFAGFQGLVDAVGGVPMWFQTPLRDPNSGLDVGEGCVTLDGYQALAFVRARALQELGPNGWSTDPTGDAGRVTRQQVFMRRVLERASQEVSVTDLRTINQLADVAIDYVTLDSTLNLRRMLDLGRRFSGLGSENLAFHSLPTERWITPGGADVQLLVADEAEQVLAIFRGGQTRAVTTTVPRRRAAVTVLNGTTIEGQASTVATALGEVGFQVASTGNAGGGWTRTTVRHGPGVAEEASLLARHFAGGADLDADDGLPEGAIVVVVGEDLTSVVASPLALTDPRIAGRPGFPTTTTTSTAVDAGGGADAGGVTTTTVPVGVVPGEPPEGVACG